MNAGPKHPESSAAARLADGEWHRLHWASPLLKGGFALVVIAGFLLANLRERLIEIVVGSGEGVPGGRGGSGENGDIISVIYSRGQTGLAILIVLGVILIAIAAFSVSWRMHTFRIGESAVEVRSGILFRHNRQARLDRIQGIHITRPLFARLFGAAKLELNVAGQDAKVELSYLGSSQVDELRREILRRASGVRAQEAVAAGAMTEAESSTVLDASTGAPSDSADQRGASALVNRRVHELLAPELDPDAAPPPSVVRIPPARLFGSLVFSEFTVGLVLVIAALFVTTVVFHHVVLLFLILPSVIGSFGYYVRRFTKSLRFSIAATADGVRVGYGLLSTSNDTVPPGRIHAIEVTQPLLWRPAGWWMIRINRAGHASNSNSSASSPHTLLLPVGTAADVEKVLGLLLPGLAGADTERVVLAGLTAKRGAGFTDAPRRAFWLRPFSWQRTGWVATPEAVLLRSGFFWRRLVVVPLARVQSLRVAQGPVRRMLRLTALHVTTIAGPVRASLGVIGVSDGVALFRSLAAAAVDAGQAEGQVTRPNAPDAAEHGALDATALASDHTVPDHAASDHTVPDHVVPDHTASDHVVAAPARTTP